MRTKQIAAIRQKCIEANPEIVELKFGCELLGEDGSKLLFDPYLVTYSVERLPHILAKTESEFINFQTKEIIGRPIRLADVLLAIDAAKPQRYHIAANGQFYRAGKEGAIWNLRADDLDQQSDGTVSFIHGLLV